MSTPQDKHRPLGPSTRLLHAGTPQLQGGSGPVNVPVVRTSTVRFADSAAYADLRSEEHTSELQSPCNLVCRLLLDTKKTTTNSPLVAFFFFLMDRRPPSSPPFPYPTLFRSMTPPQDKPRPLGPSPRLLHAGTPQLQGGSGPVNVPVVRTSTVRFADSAAYADL